MSATLGVWIGLGLIAAAVAVIALIGVAVHAVGSARRWRP